MKIRLLNLKLLNINTVNVLTIRLRKMCLLEFLNYTKKIDLLNIHTFKYEMIDNYIEIIK